MVVLMRQAQDVLRGRLDLSASGLSVRQSLGLLCCAVLAGIGYGAVMGTFGGFGGDRPVQMVYSGLKVPLLLTATFLISLPSFFVLNTLFGVRDDFGEVLRSLLATQATLTLVLLSLAPYTAFWYCSFADYEQAKLFNLVMFGVASVAAQHRMRSYYRPLIARRPRHRLLLRLWIVLYAFVGIQMAWILRPFVGSPDLPVRFFREDTWGNAYVIVAEMIWRVLSR